MNDNQPDLSLLDAADIQSLRDFAAEPGPAPNIGWSTVDRVQSIVRKLFAKPAIPQDDIITQGSF